MAELKNCRRCNKVFPYIAGLQICLACQKEEERMFEEVSLYVRDHRDVPLPIVAKEVGISYEKLMKFIREGRLQVIAPDGKIVRFCEKCGEEIDSAVSGKYCSRCEDGLSHALETSKKDLEDRIKSNNPESQKSGSYFFVKDKKK